MTAALRQFTARDDLLHPESATGPLARESLALTAPLPEEELLLFLYLWREAGTRWGRFVFLAGTDATKPEYVSFDRSATYAGDDLRDFTVGGLRARQPEPLKVAEFAFFDGELDLSLRFEGVHAPFSYHDNADGLRSWVAHDRYEQSGRTSGRLRLRGREIVIDGMGHRDHSWGTRDWNYFQHWKWINAATPDGSLTLHCMLTDALGERLTNGYVNRGGRVARLVRADVTSELDTAMLHRRVTGTFVDETGAALALDAQHAAAWSMPIQHLFLNEVAMTATLDGRPATGHVEFGWPADYLTALRGGDT